MTNAARVWLAAGILALAACSNDDDEKAKPQFRILAGGGAGATGEGGSGGAVYVASYAGGDIEVVSDGELPKLPSYTWVAPSLGSNPLTVAASTTLTADESERLVGDDGVSPATGLHVKGGAVLTLEPNVDWDGVPGNDAVSVFFDAGVIVEGTIVTGPRNGAGPDTSSLDLEATTIVVAETGVVDTNGDDVDSGTGGDAGELRLDADGSAYSAGALLARGGRGTTEGGEGSAIALFAGNGFAVHAGEMDASGGDASDGLAGDAGWAEVSVDGIGTVLNGGTMRARGGNGTTGGGDGGGLYVQVYGRGPVYGAGALDASGGDATADGDGGRGGEAYVEAYGDDAIIGGAITMKGGQAAGSGTGGAGGWVELYSWQSWGDSALVPAGRVVLGADVAVSGGAGVAGGNGGEIYVETGSRVVGAEQPQIRIIGLAAVEASGGDGGAGGGSGGAFEIFSVASRDPSGALRLGSIRNEVAIVARGGDATAGTGGVGGYVDLSAWGDSGEIANTRALAVETGLTAKVTNRGAVDVGAGSGTDAASRGGAIYLSAAGDVRNEAVLGANGGDTETGSAGEGGDIALYADTTALSQAALFVRGGTSGAGTGGFGGNVWVVGEHAKCGDATADGGASTSGAGGDGGVITVGSMVGGSTYGRVSVAAGAGIPAGAVGSVVVDGITVPLTAGAAGR